MSSSDKESERIEIGNWVLERILGSGTFGKVMLFKDQETGQMLAIKKCHAGLNINPDSWSKEVEILHNLNHPGLVNALPIPDDLKVLAREAPVLCMEYCSGGDLRQVLNKPVNCCGLPEKDVLSVAKHVASAVQYLHSKKVVHRDLKPENIVIQIKDGKKIFKLIDLGYAKDLSQQSLCKTLVGTLQYLAPELFQTDKYNCTVDYWSLGLVIHECITGVRPFLPGLPPMQWMRHAESKTHEDICVYRRPNDTVVFSTTLFKENHLNSVMQILMEQWLRLMLEWNPQFRGRQYFGEDANHLGPVVAFDQLDQILSTEIVSIFWVDGLTHLSYIVGEEISMDVLHGWIERDTGIRKQHQLLLLPRGNCPEADRSARQLIGSSSNEEISSLTTAAYLFSKVNDGSDQRVSQCHPDLMEVMLSDPRAEYPYYLQKRMWAQSTYWVNQQQSIYRKLLNALKVHSTYLTLRASLLKQQVAFVTGALRHVTAAHEIFIHSLRFDQHSFQMQSQRGGLPSCAMLEKWGNEEMALTSSLAELSSQCANLEHRFNSAMINVHDTAKNAGSFLGKLPGNEGLEPCCQAAMELYTGLQKRPRDQRDQLQNNILMTKVIVRALKVRNESFTEAFTQIRLIEKCSAVNENFTTPLLLLKHEIEQFQDQMVEKQTQRQNDVWTLLERAVTMWQRTSMINDSSSSSPTGLGSNVLSLPSLRMVDRSSQDSLMTIQENQALRYQIQDSLSRGLSSTCISTQNNLDWSFLDDQH